MSGHGLGAPPMPPRVAAYLHKVATLPTEELRHFAHHWHGEALGQFARDILKHREQGAPQHRDIGGPVTPGAMMPMMAGNPNSRRQVSWLEQMPIEQLRELAFRVSGSPMGAIVSAVLNKRMAMPALTGDAGQQPAQAPAQAAPQPAQGFSAAPMAPAVSPPPTAPAVPGGASNPWDSLVSTSARGGRIPHRAFGGPTSPPMGLGVPMGCRATKKPRPKPGRVAEVNGANAALVRWLPLRIGFGCSGRDH